MQCAAWAEGGGRNLSDSRVIARGYRVHMTGGGWLLLIETQA